MAKILPSWFMDWMSPIHEQKTFKAWAIHLGLSDWDKECLESGRSKFTGHGFLGSNSKGLSHSDMDRGCKTAMFTTRREARAYYKKTSSIKANWPRSRVVRVVVTVEAVR